MCKLCDLKDDLKDVFKLHHASCAAIDDILDSFVCKSKSKSRNQPEYPVEIKEPVKKCQRSPKKQEQSESAPSDKPAELAPSDKQAESAPPKPKRQRKPKNPVPVEQVPAESAPAESAPSEKPAQPATVESTPSDNQSQPSQPVQPDNMGCKVYSE